MERSHFAFVSLMGLAVLLPFSAIAAPVASATSCVVNPKDAVNEARRALGTPSSADDQAALFFLIEAVAALNAKLEGLRDGSVPFAGAIYAPKGVVMKKSPPSEVR
ncbi:hypothetical protein [Bradyrhizobium sp.]|uniref:hypothetical protein n=1 Tax=Bradyrhizobium sp. TaxID=376 RepID=UPI0039E5E6BD